MPYQQNVTPRSYFPANPNTDNNKRLLLHKQSLLLAKAERMKHRLENCI
jgi:hypothetical protein